MSIVGDVIKSFDGSGDLLDAQREVINSLEELAQSKAEFFISDIKLLLAGAGQGVDKTVGISKIINSEYTSRAFSSTSSQHIGQEVKDIMGSFLNGGTDSVLGGVSQLITSALTIFLGSSSGASGQQRQYFVYATPFAIYRVDWAAWYRMVTAKAIQEKVERVLSVAYTQSTVDVNSLQWSDFIAIYTQELGDIKSLTKKEIATLKQEMSDAWDWMKKESGNKPDAFLDDETLALLADTSESDSGQ